MLSDKTSGAEIFRFDQSGALLRKVMENAAVGMALIGLDRRLIYANGAFGEMLGESETGELGRDLGEFVHGDDDVATLLHVDRLIAGEIDDHRAECRLKHRDGSAIWVLAQASLLKSDKTGLPLYVILQITNIDKQKRAEAALVYSENRWNYALESAGQGVWDHDIRADTMFYSRMWRMMRGFSLDEQIDADIESWLARVHPDDVERLRSIAKKQGQGEQGFDTLEYRERHRDGHYIWILSRGKPVEWDAEGTPVRSLGTDTDITRIKTVEAQLAEEKERLRVTLESIGDGVISINASSAISFMNPVAEQMTGWTLEEARGHRLEQVFSIVDEGSGRIATSPVARCLEEGQVIYLDEDVVLIGRNAEKRDVSSSAAPLRTPGGTIVGAVLVFQDVTNSRALQKQLAHSATHDTLTGLPNRLAFERALITITDQARREFRGHALCFIDLDRFKAVNDTAGHAAGDALLREVAELIRQGCRRQDFAARIGGDEFALLLADCPIKGAERVAGKLVQAISSMVFEWEGNRYSVGASIGITVIGEGSPEPAELMGEADAACYVAKASGRGQVSVYNPAMIKPA